MDSLSLYDLGPRDKTVSIIEAFSTAGTKTGAANCPDILTGPTLTMFDELGISYGDTQTVRARKDGIEALSEMSLNVSTLVEGFLGTDIFPITYGGDHTTSIGTLRGLADYGKESGKKCGVIWFDSHGDFNTDKSTKSGNPHGMPLAIVTGDCYPEMMGGSFIHPENVLHIGANALDKAEINRFKESKITLLTMLDLIGGYEKAYQAIMKLRRDCDAVYISFDVDVMHANDAPGTPMFNPTGVRSEAMIAMLQHCVFEQEGLASLIGLDVVEFEQTKDHLDKRTVDFILRLVSLTQGVEYGPYWKHMQQESQGG